MLDLDAETQRPTPIVTRVPRCLHTSLLVGSGLQDDSRPDTDLDLPVEFDPDAHTGLIERSRMWREPSDLLGRRADLVSKGGLKPLVRQPTLESAQVLYAAA